MTQVHLPEQRKHLLQAVLLKHCEWSGFHEWSQVDDLSCVRLANLFHLIIAERGRVEVDNELTPLHAVILALILVLSNRGAF